MKTIQLILASLIIVIAGCQTGQPTKTAVIDNGSFMSLWDTYNHCHASTGIDQLREDALALASAANHSQAQESFVLPLRRRFSSSVAAPAAACSLRAGSAAVEAGKIDVAKDLLRNVLNYQPQAEYAYYTLQAKTLLSELETNLVEVTLNLP